MNDPIEIPPVTLDEAIEFWKAKDPQGRGATCGDPHHCILAEIYNAKTGQVAVVSPSPYPRWSEVFLYPVPVVLDYNDYHLDKPLADRRLTREETRIGLGFDNQEDIWDTPNPTNAQIVAYLEMLKKESAG